MAYKIEFADSTKEHLKSLTANQRAVIFAAVKKQLVHEPFVKTRNRKPIESHPVAPWELRVGDLRVFYDLSPDEPDVVEILAIGIKEGSKLLIAGKVVHL
ncbi:type II toxin-antitoxin system RelE/ParE family toxin [candidate division KSB1 bacterium]|nr:type II toxin-antitoxin system RelE/ParE family toxin [candidate division KSB1 bacterium]